ncbi:MAG: L-histidine N(alpha)-methyltransferase, partial [Alcaligenaceae bacterium]
MQIPLAPEAKPTDHLGFVPEIELGLLAQSASISPKFLYDALGSHLFTAITLLPEYYPTNTEKNIFTQYQEQIAQAIGLD